MRFELFTMSANDLQMHIFKFTRLLNRTVNSIPRENYQLSSSTAAHLGGKIIKNEERDKSVSCVTQSGVARILDCAALPPAGEANSF